MWWALSTRRAGQSQALIDIQLHVVCCELPYSRKYWRGIKFGGLAVWFATAKLKSANISYLHIYVWRSLTEPPNLNSPIFLQWRFRAKPPNLITANISSYTVVMFIDLGTHFHGCTCTKILYNGNFSRGINFHVCRGRLAFNRHLQKLGAFCENSTGVNNSFVTTVDASVKKFNPTEKNLLHCKYW